MSPLPMTVLRVQKIKSWGSLGGSDNHNNRKRATHNAKASQLDKNVYIVGKRSDRFADLVRSKIGAQTIRKNAVLAIEVVMSASPNYFRPDAPEKAGHWDQQRLQAWQQASFEWLQQKYGDRIVSTINHLDEQTPHLHAIVVPLDDKGKLNCRALLGGTRQTLRDLQTSYAKAVAHLGIARGKEGSKAQHVTVAEYYSAANAANIAALPVVQTSHPGPEPIEPAKPGFFDPKDNQALYVQAHAKWLKEHQRWSQQIRKHTEETNAQRQAAVDMFPALQAQATQVKLLEQQIEQLKKDNSRLLKERAAFKEQADRMRALPLADVLTKMYGAQENGSKPSHATRKFKLPDSTNIAITDDLWINNTLNKGSKGALNLVMHLESLGQSQLQDAVRLLLEHFNSKEVVAQLTLRSASIADKKVQQQLSEPYPAPIPNPNTWPRARHYLVETRCIPAETVDAAHRKGLVFSDARSNVVFLREQGGCFKRGSYDPVDRPAFKQSLGVHAGPFILSGLQDLLMICEGPIDALTLKALHPEATVIATGGNYPEHRLAPWLTVATDIFLAHDNDAAGDKQADLIAQSSLIPSNADVSRYRPDGFKDWNAAWKSKSNVQRFHEPESVPLQNSVSNPPPAEDEVIEPYSPEQ